MTTDIWYKARNILLGIDWYTQSTSKAFKLAQQSSHPDAQWFCSLGESVDLAKVDHPMARLYHHIQKNEFEPLQYSPFVLGRALYLRRFERMTYPHPVFDETVPVEDPFTTFIIGCLYFELSWYVNQRPFRLKAFELFHIAAKGGCNAAIRQVAEEEGLSISNRFKMLGKIVKNTEGNYLHELYNYVGNYGKLTDDAVCILGFIFLKYSRKNNAVIDGWIEFYRSNREKATDAISAWLLCAHRLNQQNRRTLLNRDIRRKIGFLIWKSRKEGLFCPSQ